MARLIVRRVISLVFVLIGLSLITFFLSHAVPANPARLMAGPRASEQTVKLIEKEYGLDKPLYDQYVTYMKGILTLNFGQSLTTQRPVRSDLARYFPATLELAVWSLVLSLVIGFPLGIISAVRPNTAIDYVGRIVSVTGVAMPVFWLALILQFLFFAKLGWFPDGQRLPVGVSPPPTITGLYAIDSLVTGRFSLFVTVIKHLALPVITLGYSVLPLITRTVRGAMLEVMGLDYIRTARAKGLRSRSVVIGHALKNGLLPVVTVIGMEIGLLLSGAVLIEIIFSWPGIGQYALNAITNFDYNGIMAVTLVIGFIYVLMNTLVDIAYMVLDPRISYA